MRKVISALLLLTMILGLAGCGQKKAPEITSLSLNKEGGISHHIVGREIGRAHV